MGAQASWERRHLARMDRSRAGNPRSQGIRAPWNPVVPTQDSCEIRITFPVMASVCLARYGGAELPAPDVARRNLPPREHFNDRGRRPGKRDARSGPQVAGRTREVRSGTTARQDPCAPLLPAMMKFAPLRSLDLLRQTSSGHPGARGARGRVPLPIWPAIGSSATRRRFRRG